MRGGGGGNGLTLKDPLTVRQTVGICLSPTDAAVSTLRPSYRTSIVGCARPTLYTEVAAAMTSSKHSEATAGFQPAVAPPANAADWHDRVRTTKEPSTHRPPACPPAHLARRCWMRCRM